MRLPLVPEQATDLAKEHDYLFGLLTGLTLFFTVVVGLLVIIFAVKYRESNKRVNRKRPVHENLKVEIAWTVIPLFMALGVFAWSASLYVRQRTVPENASEIFVIGKQWMWHVQHPNGVRENNRLTVPVGQPIKLNMISQDVIHAFYVPEFRNQFMVVPGRYTHMSFTPTRTGEFKLFCNMYCGTLHSQMVGYVRVVTREKYEEFLAAGGEELGPMAKTMAEKGKELFDQYNCGSCHGPEDTRSGPSLVNTYGKRRQLASGEAVVADDDYIRAAIVHTNKQVTAGYDVMPSYEGQFSEEQVLHLLTYIRSLGFGSAKPGEKPGAPTSESAAETAGGTSR